MLQTDFLARGTKAATVFTAIIQRYGLCLLPIGTNAAVAAAGISITSLHWRFEDEMDNEPNDSLLACTQVQIYTYTHTRTP